MKVCVLGAAGGIGQPLSLLLKLNLPAGSELSLYDVAPFTPGVAVDLSHIPTDVCVTGYVGDDVEAAMKDSDIVVIPAGVPRKPGMTRDDLFNVNAPSMLKALSPSALKAETWFRLTLVKWCPRRAITLRIRGSCLRSPTPSPHPGVRWLKTTTAKVATPTWHSMVAPGTTRSIATPVICR